MSWRKLPPILLVGLVIQIIYSTVRVLRFQIQHDAWNSGDWNNLDAGLDFVTAAFVLAGALELARRTSARVAFGAKLLAASQIAELAMSVMWTGLNIYASVHHSEDPSAIFEKAQYLSPLVMLATAIGFGLVSSRPSLAVGLPIVVFFVLPFPVVGHWMYAHHDLGEHLTMFLMVGPYAILPIVWLAVAITARGELAPAETTLATVPFERAAGALWLRVATAGGLVALGLLAGVARDTGSIMRFAAVVAPLVTAVAYAGLARAAIGLARAGVSPRVALSSAVGALWCVGVLIVQESTVYLASYGGDGGGMRSIFARTDDATRLTTEAPAVPFVGAIAIALVLIAIARLARARGLEELRENVTIRTGAFVVLALGALFITHYGIQKTSGDTPVAFAAILAATGAMVYALVIAARICTAAAAIVRTDPAGLPRATASVKA